MIVRHREKEEKSAQTTPSHCFSLNVRGIRNEDLVTELFNTTNKQEQTELVSFVIFLSCQ